MLYFIGKSHMRKINVLKKLMRLHRENPFRIIAGFFDYALINKKSKPHFEAMPHLSTLIDSLKINCFIDAGANIGNFGCDVRKMGYKGKIVSFEPVNNTYEELIIASEGDPLWHTYKLALGNINGNMNINVTKNSDLCSLLKPNHYLKKIFQEKSSIVSVETIEIRTLDSMINELVKDIAEPRIFLKMDTQGYDGEVFKGAAGCMDKIFGLSSELSASPLYQEMLSYVDSMKLYKDNDFLMTGMYPVSRDNDLTIIEFDCFMKKRDKILL
jgi:FkbM family methyltransferase